MSPSHTSGVGEPIGARSGAAVEGSCEWWQLSSEANQIQFVFLLSKFVSDDFANPMILERYFRRQQLFASTVMWDVSFYEILMWDVYSHESLRGARCIYEKFSYHEQNFDVHLWALTKIWNAFKRIPPLTKRSQKFESPKKFRHPK
jgi:hypothetical protein